MSWLNRLIRQPKYKKPRSLIFASNVKRSYKTTSLSYKLDAEGLVNGELITTPGLYTGTISVKEASGKYSIDMTGVTFRNYDYAGVQPIGGDVTIIKGIPTIVTYNTEGNAGAARHGCR